MKPLPSGSGERRSAHHGRSGAVGRWLEMCGAHDGAVRVTTPAARQHRADVEPTPSRSTGIGQLPPTRSRHCQHLRCGSTASLVHPCGRRCRRQRSGGREPRSRHAPAAASTPATTCSVSARPARDADRSASVTPSGILPRPRASRSPVPARRRRHGQRAERREARPGARAEAAGARRRARRSLERSDRRGQARGGREVPHPRRAGGRSVGRRRDGVPARPSLSAPRPAWVPRRRGGVPRAAERRALASRLRRRGALRRAAGGRPRRDRDPQHLRRRPRRPLPDHPRPQGELDLPLLPPAHPFAVGGRRRGSAPATRSASSASPGTPRPSAATCTSRSSAAAASSTPRRCSGPGTPTAEAATGEPRGHRCPSAPGWVRSSQPARRCERRQDSRAPSRI